MVNGFLWNWILRYVGKMFCKRSNWGGRRKRKWLEISREESEESEEECLQIVGESWGGKNVGWRVNILIFPTPPKFQGNSVMSKVRIPLQGY